MSKLASKKFLTTMVGALSLLCANSSAMAYTVILHNITAKPMHVQLDNNNKSSQLPAGSTKSYNFSTHVYVLDSQRINSQLCQFDRSTTCLVNLEQSDKDYGDMSWYPNMQCNPGPVGVCAIGSSLN